MWLNGSTPDCESVVTGSNPAPPQHRANSVSPYVGCYLGWHSTVCWPLRDGRGTNNTQKNLKIYRKNFLTCQMVDVIWDQNTWNTNPVSEWKMTLNNQTLNSQTKEVKKLNRIGSNRAEWMNVMQNNWQGNE
jgi:hypothetical protein